MNAIAIQLAAAAFTAATTRAAFRAACRGAAQLAPHDQLEVVDALRTAQSRLAIRAPRSRVWVD